VDLKQETFILGQPRQKAVPRASRLQLVHTRKDLTMLLHLIGTEQFRSKRQFIAGILLLQVASAEARPDREKGSANGLAAHLHF
jgi:hypothetical protein